MKFLGGSLRKGEGANFSFSFFGFNHNYFNGHFSLTMKYAPLGDVLCNFRRTVNHVISTLIATCVDIGSRLASGKNLEFLFLVPKSVLHSLLSS